LTKHESWMWNPQTQAYFCIRHGPGEVVTSVLIEQGWWLTTCQLMRVDPALLRAWSEH